MPKPRKGLLLSIAAMLLAAGCASPVLSPTPPTPSATAPTDSSFAAMEEAPADRFLFVELWVTVEGTGALPRLMIDFPAYRFDAQARTLRSFSGDRSISLAPSAWGFVGQGASRRGDAGGGAASQLVPIPELPFTIGISIFTGKAQEGREELRQAPVVLQSVDAQGRVAASIDGRRLILAPGESWSQVIEADVRTRTGRGHYRITSSVTNYGWLDRSQVTPAE